ncbi:glycoside hydrolase family 3 protein [Nocardioides sp. P5_E3]
MNLTPRRSSPPLRSPEQRRGDPEATQSTESRTDDLRALALRVLLPGFAGTTLPDDYRALLEQGLGGICYFGSNTADGHAALAALSAEIRAANPAAVVAVDEEGGDVSRLHTREPSPVLGAAALGGAADLELTEAVGRWVGHELASVGVTLDLAPDADVNSDPDNPVIGTRSFGVDPEQVAAHVAAWTRGLQSTGVAACAKHFPGHGDTATDSHLDLPRIDVDPDTLAARELVPFDAAVEAGTAAVMTSHIVVPAIDPDRPATLSPLVLGMLREVLGFDGVVVSDALDMAGASAVLGIPDSAVLALAAGCDLLCLGPDKPAAMVLEVRDAVVAAVADGRLAHDRLADAAGRVAAMRVPATATHPELPDASRQASAAASATRVDGALPGLAGAVVVSVDTAANIAVGDVAWGLPADHRLDPGSLADGLPDAVPGGVPLVVQVRDAGRRPEVLAFLRALAEDGRPAVVVEWGWPSTHDVGLTTISTRGSSAPGVEAVTRVLRGAGWTR